MRSRRLFVLVVTGLLVGCGAHVRPVSPPPPSSSLPVQPFAGLPNAQSVTLALEPIVLVIGRAESELSAGEAELALGHFVAAREHFDAAVDVLLAAPGGARGNDRLQATFDRILDRISAHETLELRAADGFVESHPEPAIIDNLLAIASAERVAIPAPTTAEIVAADLAHTTHDIAIQANNKVLSYIELFQNELHDFMEEGLERGSRYLPMIQAMFKSQGLPLDLAYVPLIESAFKPTALSKAKAKGMWQFEAATAKDVGLRQTWFLDERSDPEKATRAAGLYLRDLRDMFAGDWNLALAAYNAGQGRVLRAMRIANTADYWKLTASARYLPRETREYVPMILAAMLIAKNPSQYGFEIGPIEPLAYDKVVVADALSLGVIAEWLNVPVAEIQALNPELRRGITPNGKHELKVPAGTGELIERKIAAAGSSIFASTFRFYTVKKGDTLATIARKYKIAGAKLAAANDLKPGSKVRLGTTLMVPAAPPPSIASAARTSKPRTVLSGAPRTYRVKTGDTLAGIARQFDITIDNLKRLNRLSSDTIVAGDTLNLRR